MAFNILRTATFYDKEILKYPKGFEAVRGCVIDASSVSANSDGRYIVEAGSVMVASTVDASKVKVAASSGISASDVKGILAYTVELYGVSTPWVGTLTTTATSTTVTVASTTSGTLAVGQTVVSANIPQGATVVSISGSTAVLTAAATAAGTGTAATANNVAYDEPAAMFFDDCIFDTSKLINYASNATAVKSALSTSLFE